MKSWKKGLAIGAVAVLAIIGIAALFLTKRVESFRDKYEGMDLTQEVEGMERTGGQTGYLLEHEGAKNSDQDIDIDLSSYEAEGDVKFEASYEGESNVLYTELNSKVTFKVNAPEEGFYNLYLEYYLPESRGVAAERAVYINGELPFDDAINISFSRVWVDGGDKRIDNQGNEIRPKQVEEYCWQSAYFRDKLGYISEPYKFFLNKGENEVTIEAVNEPMAIKSLAFTSVFELATYEEYTAANSGNSAGQTEGYTQIVQGEQSSRRSESSLYAKYDRSSPSTQPMSLKHTVLNYVGGEAWSTNGQWIEWEVTVEEDGFYNLTVKGRQNYSRGNVSNRTLYIDGEIPFKEVEEISFPYTNNWDLITLSDENGTPYNFYLTKGTHTIRLEASLGELGSILEEIEDSTYRLNQIYRKILVYTGATPDQYRDYHIETTYPEVMKAMDLESKRLYKIVDDMVDYSGQKADSIATAQTLAQQLERFCEKPNKITTEFTTFKDNITSLGTSTLNLSMTKLDIDYIEVTAAGTAPEKDSESALDRIGHEIKSFVISFFVDYNAVGDVYGDDEDVVKVWVLTGRDQGTILKSLIDEEFTPDTGIKVNVEIVDAGALQSAVIAGRGPNVVLSIGADQPVNYALRGAAEDITQFADYQEVLANYSESSYEQISLDGHIYGIPETQTFNVMFYRKDVMEELGLKVPDTWDELIAEMPTIQGKNLSVGIPSAAGSSSQATTSIMSANADLTMYFSLLFQYGGDVYNEAGNKTTVDTEAGIKAFEDYVRYFNDYGIPTVYDFVSRFRSGEMPIGIAPYSTYNTLMVSAPEIRGLWDFTLIPGTVRQNEDGTTYIDRSDFISGAATMMIKTEDEQLRQKSWEFMKWWASPDTQVSFGREIEALLGASARYATANREAFSNLSWSADDIEVLNAQWDQTRGIREVPGGYYTGRHISNAIRKVFNEKVDSRETIIDYSIKIDDELTKKRKEFGLPVYGE